MEQEYENLPESVEAETPAEPNWRSVAWSHEQLAKLAHSTADQITKRDKAAKELQSAVDNIEYNEELRATALAELAALV